MKRFLVFVLMSAIVSGCSKQTESEQDQPAVVEVKTAQARYGDIDETVSVTGETSVLREVQLRSPISGVIVRFTYFPGDSLRKGETVAIVMTREAQASLQGAEELEHAAVSDEQKREAQDAIDLARRTAATVAIRAPFSGILSVRSKNENEVVSEGEQIGSMVDPGSVCFVAHVPAESLSKVRVGQRTTIRLTKLPGREFSGTIRRLDPQVNPIDQTAAGQIAFSGVTRGFERGLVGIAEIAVGRRTHVLLVPTVSLLHDDESGTTSVVIVGGDSLSRKIAVDVGLRHDLLSEVSSPELKSGMEVITEGQYGLPDSTRVRPLHMFR